jgi:hypothetical protein
VRGVVSIEENHKKCHYDLQTSIGSNCTGLVRGPSAPKRGSDVSLEVPETRVQAGFGLALCLAEMTRMSYHTLSGSNPNPDQGLLDSFQGLYRPFVGHIAGIQDGTWLE